MKANPKLYPCPVGKYCPEGADPIDCPRLTYRDQYEGKSSADCFTCPAGYWCSTKGMASYNTSACPIGKYCRKSNMSIGFIVNVLLLTL